MKKVNVVVRTVFHANVTRTEVLFRAGGSKLEPWTLGRAVVGLVHGVERLVHSL